MVRGQRILHTDPRHRNPTWRHARVIPPTNEPGFFECNAGQTTVHDGQRNRLLRRAYRISWPVDRHSWPAKAAAWLREATTTNTECVGVTKPLVDTTTGSHRAARASAHANHASCTIGHSTAPNGRRKDFSNHRPPPASRTRTWPPAYRASRTTDRAPAGTELEPVHQGIGHGDPSVVPVHRRETTARTNGSHHSLRAMHPMFTDLTVVRAQQA